MLMLESTMKEGFKGSGPFPGVIIGNVGTNS